MRIALAILFIAATHSVAALNLTVRDIARVSWHRENQVSGYGVVIGLNGSGDSRSQLALETLKKNLYNRGIDLGEKTLQAKNIAAVMVTANIPVHARPGDPVDVWVSSIGDARALNGGMLLQTALTGGTDVHTRTLANRFEPFENLDGISAIRFLLLLGSHGRGGLLGIKRAGRYSTAASLVHSLPGRGDRTGSEAAFLHG